MGELHTIRAFLQINDRLATGGMPQPEDFTNLQRAGYDTVINLAMPTSDHALANEGDLVTRAGMTYMHIPVNFESPQGEDFDCFARVMDAFSEQRLFVHCAANMRVSAFIFLYRVLRQHASRADAERDLRKIWEPDGLWLNLIDSQLGRAGHPPLGTSQDGR